MTIKRQFGVPPEALYQMQIWMSTLLKAAHIFICSVLHQSLSFRCVQQVSLLLQHLAQYNPQEFTFKGTCVWPHLLLVYWRLGKMSPLCLLMQRRTKCIYSTLIHIGYLKNSHQLFYFTFIQCIRQKSFCLYWEGGSVFNRWIKLRQHQWNTE